jgi:glycosyltransferase involved in cell wall biosynthesis
MFKIFCVIPAYNVEQTISEVMDKVSGVVDELVVVDDGSSDQTRKLIKAKIKARLNASLLCHIVNRGQGAALATGTSYALKHGANIIVHFDADGQFLAEEIPSLVAPIKAGEADVVLGSRFLNKTSNIPWFKKNIIIPLAKIVNRTLLGVSGLTDPQSGFRALSREAAQKITITQDRMAHCSEILSKIFKNKFRVKEVPITVIYHHFGQKFGGGIKIIKELFLGSFLVDKGS